MDTKIEFTPNEPIMMVEFPPHITGENIDQSYAAAVPFVEQWNTTVYRITDARAVKLNFGAMLTLMTRALHSGPGSLADKRIVEIIVVPESGLLKLGAASLEQRQYGALSDYHIMHDLEAALAFARAEIVKKQTEESA